MRSCNDSVRDFGVSSNRRSPPVSDSTRYPPMLLSVRRLPFPPSRSNDTAVVLFQTRNSLSPLIYLSNSVSLVNKMVIL